MKTTIDLSDYQIRTIYDYCVGGYNQTQGQQKQAVKNFLSENNVSVGEAMQIANEMIGSEKSELHLNGYYDY